MSQCVADCDSTAYPTLVTLPSALFLYKIVKCFMAQIFSSLSTCSQLFHLSHISLTVLLALFHRPLTILLGTNGVLNTVPLLVLQSIYRRILSRVNQSAVLYQLVIQLVIIPSEPKILRLVDE